MGSTMTAEQFEQAYEQLARALDRVGPEKERLFLARLALALAHRMPDPADFRDALAVAESDLVEAGSRREDAP